MPLTGWTRAFLGLAAFSLAGMAFSRATGLKPGLIAPLASVAMVACGALGVWASVSSEIGRSRAAWAAVSVAALGAGAELLGLHTGAPFGRYEYTDAWRPVVALPDGHWFPLLLPFAWAMMAISAFLIAARWVGERWAALGGGLLAAVANIPMEPAMTGPLGYWRWLDPGPMPGGAPITNFLGWWLTAAIAGFPLCRVGAARAKLAPDATVILAGFCVFVLIASAIGG